MLAIFLAKGVHGREEGQGSIKFENRHAAGTRFACKRLLFILSAIESANPTKDH